MKRLRTLILILFACLLFESCATIMGGQVTECQRIKPLPGQPQREVRVGYLVVDIIFSPIWIVDFATCAIYKPCNVK